MKIFHILQYLKTIAVSKDIGSRKKQNLIMVIVFTPTEYVKLKTGTGVEKTLLNAIVRKYIYPQIEFEHLLHCLANELYYYINNSKDPISKQELYDIVENAYNENIDKYSTMIKQQQTEKKKMDNKPSILHQIQSFS